jgi:murein DD-endopeptidase MepM/ murein hydrolase activator NlpD
LFVLLTHGDGYETMYGHLSRVLVARGDRVRVGQVIALSGNSGRSTAPHLHFEVRRRGRSVDPLSLVREGN